MSESIADRLEKLGITLPDTAAPLANYVPFVITGKTVFVSGQLPLLNGELQSTGKLGADLSVEDGQAAAHFCALNLIAQAREAAGGDLEKIAQVVRLGGFVNCTPDFTEQAQVINGASDVMVDVFENKGRHARAAVGCVSLPRGASVEVDGIFELA
ncbi:MAG: RidA family protein [Rhodospirillaceae bacterium]|jgi:enamine deaminase RidA (YjgF/YER057c/UK114 family)